MELVTGHAGKDHVKASHQGTMNMGIIGSGSYVLSTGSKLAATMINSNTVRIADGDIVIQGRQATIEAGTYDDLTIENGTQNQKRNDLVVVRYEKLAQEPRTESATLKVIKGEPSDGEAEDPEYESGDIASGDLVAEVPLYRIPLDGISVGEPVPLCNVMMSMSELRDSVSQATGVENIPLSLGSGTVSCIRCGRLVTLNFFTSFTLPAANGQIKDVLSGLPKPARTEPGILIQQETFSVWYAHVDADGVLRAERKSQSGGGFAWYIGHFCYIAADGG